VKNHSVADFNLREETIHDYIHHCTIFGMTHFSRKPRWVLQYLQSSPDDDVHAPEKLSPPQHMTLQRKSPAPQRHSPSPDEDSLRPTNSRQRPELASSGRVLSGPTRSAPSPPPDGTRKENPVAVAMGDVSATVSPAPAQSALAGIDRAVSPPSPTPKSPPTSPLMDGFVGLQVNYCTLHLSLFARACVREQMYDKTSCANTVCVIRKNAQLRSFNGKAPVHVVAISDLMDRNNRLQGERGYSNPLVRPGDELTHIGNNPLVGSSLDEIQVLLRGPRGSKVDLTFARTDGVQTHSFLVQALRHRAHSAYSPQHSPQQSNARTPFCRQAEVHVQHIFSSESPEPRPNPSKILSDVLNTVLGSGASRPSSQAGM
jgi:hypothetical protein